MRNVTFFYLANAGDNITIALPETRTVLDGSKSKDDIKIVSYQWQQIRYDRSSWGKFLFQWRLRQSFKKIEFAENYEKI